ncbi:transcriptional regulator, MarR family [Kribbella flavida DSM 17836]|uniref:Transcriptional regulator, MarR family n=1 Tax=Kribbella flavida (strain DSM 17836 / JCM 10339 / NBRC 14399) TaxID=479435 RepID=D2PXJ9_KRIFD|nr:MarR family transcriptional regulator [Kribbella flavida]ADB31641.1 transcriptional regulator, MarR family [Kribbella flavida DSM 17836]
MPARDSIDRHIAYWRAEVPGLDPDVEGVVTRMQMLVRHLQRRRTEALGELGLLSWEYDILWQLRAAGPPYQVTPTALAIALDTHPATLTHRLDRLTRAGLVERARDRADRRSVVVVLTDQGHRAWESAIGSQADAEGLLLAPLSESERRTLVRLLRKVVLASEKDGTELMVVPRSVQRPEH